MLLTARTSGAAARAATNNTGIVHIVSKPSTSRQPSCVSERGRKRSVRDSLHDLVVGGPCKDRDSKRERPSSGPCPGVIVDVAHCLAKRHARTVVEHHPRDRKI